MRCPHCLQDGNTVEPDLEVVWFAAFSSSRWQGWRSLEWQTRMRTGPKAVSVRANGSGPLTLATAPDALRTEHRLRSPTASDERERCLTLCKPERPAVGALCAVRSRSR